MWTFLGLGGSPTSYHDFTNKNRPLLNLNWHWNCIGMYIPFNMPTSTEGVSEWIYIYIYINEYCFTSLSAQSWQYCDRKKPEAGTMPYSYFEWLRGFFIVQSTIGSTVHSIPLNSLEHCICTTTMTNIRPDRDSNLVPPGYKPQSIRMSHRGRPGEWILDAGQERSRWWPSILVLHLHSGSAGPAFHGAFGQFYKIIQYIISYMYMYMYYNQPSIWRHKLDPPPTFTFGKIFPVV